MRVAGAWWYYEDENGQPLTIAGIECKFRSKKALLDALYGNEEFRKFFKEKIDQLELKMGVSDEEMKQIQKEEEVINTFGAIDAEIAREESAEDIPGQE